MKHFLLALNTQKFDFCENNIESISNYFKSINSDVLIIPFLGTNKDEIMQLINISGKEIAKDEYIKNELRKIRESNQRKTSKEYLKLK